MISFDLFHNNIFAFCILSSIIIISINKIFSNFIIKGKIYDLNEKNNNNLVYTGFGFSFVIITLIYLLFFLISSDGYSQYFKIKYLSIPISVIVIGFIGFLDDYKSTPIHLRLSLFFICCFLSTSSLNNDILPLIPFHKVQLIILTFFWVYVVNASNFLDGGDKYYINFILPSSIFFILYYYFIDYNIVRLQINILIAIFIFHFSFYNKDPQKFFLGDTGSLSIGFIFCWNIFNLVENQEYILGILMSLYILSDVTLTLLIRIIYRKNIFSRHKGFFIHVSSYLGRTKKEIANSILIINIILVIIALIYKLYFTNYILFVFSLLIYFLYLFYLIKFKFNNLKYIYKN